MDAKTEAEKRYPALHADDEELTYPRSALREFRRASFEAGAAWALREFGDMLDVAGSNAYVDGEWDSALGVNLMGFGSEAHHLADGIEEGA